MLVVFNLLFSFFNSMVNGLNMVDSALKLSLFHSLNALSAFLDLVFIFLQLSLLVMSDRALFLQLVHQVSVVSDLSLGSVNAFLSSDFSLVSNVADLSPSFRNLFLVMSDFG